MKPTLNSPELAPLLAFRAHPDDIESGCGGGIASETHAGRKVHFVVCWRGEAGSHGTPNVDLQLLRARLLGARTGVDHAIALFPNDPLVINSLAQVSHSARRF